MTRIAETLTLIWAVGALVFGTASAALFGLGWPVWAAAVLWWLVW